MPLEAVDHEVFGCPLCEAALTVPLRTCPPELCGDGLLQMRAPEGTWLRDPAPRQRPGAPIVVSTHALTRTCLHPDPQRVIGCCGVSFRSGLPNLLCPGCGEAVGYLLTDGDHAPWAAYLPENVVQRRVRDAPSDEALALRCEQWRGQRARHPEDPGHPVPTEADHFLSAWNGAAHLRTKSDDPESLTLEEVPGLCSLTLWPRPDGRVAMEIDEHNTFLPWSAQESLRVGVLGPACAGTSEEPAWRYIDYQGPEGSLLQSWSGEHTHAVRDAWHSWVIEDQLLVLWDRWHHPSARRRAFRLAVCEWEEAWRAARRRVQEVYERGPLIGGRR